MDGESVQTDDDRRRQWAEQRRREQFERLCADGYTVCCGGGEQG